MNCIVKLVLTLILLPPVIKPPASYLGAAVHHCNGNKDITSSSIHTCNSQHSPCRAFLMFTSKHPYVTVPAIANLTSSDKTEISRINNITASKVLPEGREVIVPVRCSCSGRNYQATTTYQILPHETYFVIAHTTFQGLSTCYTLKQENAYPETSLLPGQKLRVPLRCACPTTRQVAAGTKYLLTYSVGHGDTLLALTKRFNVSVTSIHEANSFLDKFVEIQPLTTIIIPLPSEPSHLSTSSPLQPPVALKSRLNKFHLIVGITAGAFFLLILLIVVLLFRSHKKRAQVAVSRGRNEKVPSSQELILEIKRLDRASCMSTWQMDLCGNG